MVTSRSFCSATGSAQGAMEEAEVLLAYDAALAGVDVLLAGLDHRSQALAVPRDADAIQLISQALAATGAQQLVLLCHGQPGALLLGAEPINRHVVAREASQLARWALRRIDLYACHVAGDPLFITQLAQHTGAAVAASSGRVGHPSLGASWQLTGGAGNGVVPFSRAARAAWVGSLATTLEVGQEKVYTTIQDAVSAASAGDTIEVAAGDYTGVVSVNKRLTIKGANAGTAGSSPARATGSESVLTGGFWVTAAGVTLDGLKIAEGSSISGETTGIYIAADNATIANMVIERSAVQETSNGIVTASGTSDYLTVRDSLINGFFRGIYLNPGSEHVMLTGNTFGASTLRAVANDGLDATDQYKANTFLGIARVSALVKGSIDISGIIIDAGADANSFANGADLDTSITSAVTSNGEVITGTAFDDFFRGNHNYAESFSGRAGNDSLQGGGGNDSLYGSEGGDTLDGGAGADRLDGQAGVDTYIQRKAESVAATAVSLLGFKTRPDLTSNDRLFGNGSTISFANGIDVLFSDGTPNPATGFATFEDIFSLQGFSSDGLDGSYNQLYFGPSQGIFSAANNTAYAGQLIAADGSGWFNNIGASTEAIPDTSTDAATFYLQGSYAQGVFTVNAGPAYDGSGGGTDFLVFTLGSTSFTGSLASGTFFTTSTGVFIVDGKPAAPILQLNGDTGSDPSDGITSNLRMDVSGIEPGATWEYSTDSGSTWMDGSGSGPGIVGFDLSGNATYTPGTIRVRQTDTAGYSSPEGRLATAITTDTTPPATGTLTFAGLQDTGSTDSPTPITLDRDFDLSLTGADPSATVIYQQKLGNESFTDLSSNQLRNLPDGSYSFQAVVSDLAGNQASSNTITVVIDNSAPAAPTITLPPDTGNGTSGSNADGLTNILRVDVSGIEAGATWQYRLDGSGTWINGSGTSFDLAADASYASGAIQVRQFDAAGNESSIRASQTAIATDTTAPAAPTIQLQQDTGSDPNDGITSNLRVDVSGIETGAKWKYSTDNGGNWIDGSGSGAGVFGFDLSGNTTYNAGDIRVRQIDGAGNTSTDASLGKIETDTTAPAAPTIQLNADTGSDPSDGITSNLRVDVSGIEDGAKWQYSTNSGGNWIDGSGSGAGVFGFDLSGNTTYNAGDIRVRQIDGAGNTSTDASLGKIETDTTPPAAPSVGLRQDTGLNPSDGITGNPTVDASGIEDGALWEYSSNGGETWTPGLPLITGQTVYVDPTVTVTATGGGNFTDSGTGSKASPYGSIESALKQVWTQPGTHLIDLAAGIYDSYNIGSNPFGGVGTLYLEDFPTRNASNTILFRGAGAKQTVLKPNANGTMPDNTFNPASGSGGNGGFIRARLRRTSGMLFFDMGFDLSKAYGGTSSSKNNFAFFSKVEGSDASPQGLEFINVELDLGPYGVLTRVDNANNNLAGLMEFSNSLIRYGGNLSDFSGSADPSSDPNRTNFTGLYADAMLYVVNDAWPTSGTILGVGPSTVFEKTTDGTNYTPIDQADLKSRSTNLSAIGGTDQVRTNTDLNLFLSPFSTGPSFSFSAGTISFDLSGNTTYPAGSILVRQRDLAGNVSAPGSLGQQVTITSAPLTAPLILSLPSDTGSTETPPITRNLTVTVGNLDPLYSWQYSIDSGSNWTTGSGTSFELAANASYAIGAIQVRQVDGSFNSVSGLDASSSSALITDNTPPTPGTLSFTGLADTGSTDTPIPVTTDKIFSLSLTGTADANPTTVAYQLSVDASASTWTDTSANQNLTQDGLYRYRAVVTDAAGNAATTNVVAVRIDASTPAAPSFALQDDTGSSTSDGVTNNPAIDVRGIEPGATWQYRLDGSGTWSDGSGTSFNLATDASYAIGAIQVRQIDQAGNESSITASQTAITTDSTKPAAPSFLLRADTGSSSSDGVTNNPAIDVSGIETGAKWQYSTNSGGTWSDGSGTSFLLAADASYAIGAIQVRQFDQAGNESSIAASQTAIATDSTKPAAPSFRLREDTGSSSTDGVTNNPAIDVSGIEPGAKWQYSTNSGGTWSDGSGTSFSLAANANYRNGAIQVRQIDKAGNISITTSPTAITTDTNRPVAPTLSLAREVVFNEDNSLTITVGNLEPNGSWFHSYPLDASSSVTQGTGNSFTIPGNKEYNINQIGAIQLDRAGNSSVPTFNVDARAVTSIRGTLRNATNLYNSATKGAFTGLGNEAVTLTDASATATALNQLDGFTTGLIDAGSLTSISGLLSEVLAVYSSTGSAAAANDTAAELVSGLSDISTLNQPPRRAPSRFPTNPTPPRSGTSTRFSGLGNEAIALGDGSLNLDQLNQLDGFTTGLIDASAAITLTGTVAAATAALQSTGISGLSGKPIALTDTSATATALNLLDTSTTGLIDASGVTRLTGNLADLNTTYDASGITITGLGNEAVTLTDASATATALNLLDTSTTGLIDASGVTRLTGNLADLKTTYDASGITGLGNEAVTLTDASATAAALNQLDTKTTGLIDAGSLTSISGLLSEVLAVYSSTGSAAAANDTAAELGTGLSDISTLNQPPRRAPSRFPTNPTPPRSGTSTRFSGLGNEAIALGDGSLNLDQLNQLDGFTTGLIDASAATTLTGTVAAATAALQSTGISGLSGKPIALTDTSATATALNLLDTSTTGLIDASGVTAFSGSLEQADQAYRSTGITNLPGEFTLTGGGSTSPVRGGGFFSPRATPLTVTAALQSTFEQASNKASFSLNYVGDSSNNTIAGSALNDTFSGGGGADTFTGGGGANTYLYPLLSDSTLTNMDKITDFVIGSDRIDGPTAVAARAVFRAADAVTALSETAIAQVLTEEAFKANGAATFTVTDTTTRTFVALNNGVAGFQAGSDALIEITGYTGTLTNLAIS